MLMGRKKTFERQVVQDAVRGDQAGAERKSTRAKHVRNPGRNWDSKSVKREEKVELPTAEQT